MVNFTHHDAGTPESAWRSDWRAGRQLDIEALFSGRLPERAVILAAHPDDETLAAAGLLTRLARRCSRRRYCHQRRGFPSRFAHPLTGAAGGRAPP